MVGTFFELGSVSAMECLANSGMDFAIIDTEHGYFSEETVMQLIIAAENGGLLPYVRIGDIRRPYVLRMLDIGARGLIVPNITDVSQVRELVRHAKFKPVGNRGFCPSRTSAWGAQEWSKDVNAYMEECNRRVKLIPQCETKEALEQIDEIAALEGVDGIFVGPCDLSISLGVPLQFDSQVMTDAMHRILAACRKHGKQAVFFASTVENARKWLDAGYQDVALNVDATIFTNALKDIADALH